jgi:Aspartyl protease
VKTKYTKLNGTFERPYLEIAVSHNRHEEPYLVLVDSGADTNVFSATLAEDLGLILEDGAPLEVQGATGEAVTFYEHSITITAAGKTFETTAAFADVSHLALAGLVGQQGFFDHFLITFDAAGGEFELKPKK